jgi:predicted neuraminidase
MRRVIISTKGERQWQGIPAIERAPNGRLWCAFFSGGPKEPDVANYLLLTTSADDGATWTEPRPMAVPEPGTRAYDPALWHDPSGRLWLFYNLSNAETRQHGVWAITAEDSASAEPTWSAPRQIPLGVPFAFRLNKPTVLRSGAWALPVTWRREAPEGWFARDGQLQGVALTADQGVTWTFHGHIEAPAWALENMLAERNDGRLWMLIRTGAGVLWQSTSDDGGRTWAPGAPTEIVNPGVRFCIRRLASGRLLLINTPHPTQRRGLIAYLSDPRDETRFGPGLELDPRDKVSYPDAVQAPDGTLYAVHDCDRHGPGEIILDVFSESDIPTA